MRKRLLSVFMERRGKTQLLLSVATMSLTHRLCTGTEELRTRHFHRSWCSVQFWLHFCTFCVHLFAFETFELSTCVHEHSNRATSPAKSASAKDGQKKNSRWWSACSPRFLRKTLEGQRELRWISYINNTGRRLNPIAFISRWNQDQEQTWKHLIQCAFTVSTRICKDHLLQEPRKMDVCCATFFCILILYSPLLPDVCG